IVHNGVVPEWLQHCPFHQVDRPKNRSTVKNHRVQVRRPLCKGQNDGRFSIVKSSLTNQWKEVHILPIGVVSKADGNDIRLNNDYSFPLGASVNDYTDRNQFPETP
ncbi:hypothetical protein PHMEG_00036085, partial [Phytophthora megakarya]